MHGESRGCGDVPRGEKSTPRLAVQRYKIRVLGGNSGIAETKKTVVGRSLCRSVLTLMVGTSHCSGLMLLRRLWSLGERLCAERENHVSKFGCYVFCWMATSLALQSLQQPVGGKVLHGSTPRGLLCSPGVPWSLPCQGLSFMTALPQTSCQAGSQMLDVTC